MLVPTKEYSHWRYQTFYNFLVDGVRKGSFCASDYPEFTHITCVHIAEDQRRKGYGKQMMREAVELLGDSIMRLEVVRSNTPAVKIYKATGFKTISRHTGSQTVYEMQREPTKKGGDTQ